MGTAGSFVGAGFDALPARVAILDDDGYIVYTNQSWKSFGSQQGLQTDEGGVGTNYLTVCDGSTDGDGTEAADGIRSVADGDTESFSLEYPCHTPSEDGWFTMRATPYRHDGERYVLVMHVDITERRLLERQAREQADRMESFATLLSHDLRNPLAVAMAQAESLEQEFELDAADSLVDGAALQSSLERMEAIIDDALVLVRTDDVERPEAIRLEDAVAEAWSHVRTDDADVSVAGSATIRADDALLTHLFENLFRNAIEHAGPAPSVEVGPLEDGDGFYVEDDGPGIPSADRDRIFDSGYTTNTDGTGFGLAIVSRVVDAHDWTITVADADDGARFEIRGVAVPDASGRVPSI